MFQTLHEISKNLVFVWKYVWKYVNINVSDIKKKKKKEYILYDSIPCEDQQETKLIYKDGGQNTGSLWGH